MSEGTVLDFKSHYIECPRFKGQRSAAACILFDRYKICRRRCKTLESHLKDNRDLTEKVKGYVDERKENKNTKLFLGGWKSCRFFGQNLPNDNLNCKYCNFVASSERGLKVHLKRTHKK